MNQNGINRVRAPLASSIATLVILLSGRPIGAWCLPVNPCANPIEIDTTDVSLRALRPEILAAARIYGGRLSIPHVALQTQRPTDPGRTWILRCDGRVGTVQEGDIDMAVDSADPLGDVRFFVGHCNANRQLDYFSPLTLRGGATPLQQWFAAATPLDRLRVNHTREGVSLDFPDSPPTSDLRRHEAISAAAAGYLSLRPPPMTGRGPVAGAPSLRMQVGAEGVWRIPDSLVQSAMEERYGGGTSFAPTPEEWSAWIAATTVCLPRYYPQPGRTIPNDLASQSDLRCRALSQLIGNLDGDVSLRVTLVHTEQRILRGATEPHGAETREEITVSQGPSSPRWSEHLATVWDRAEISGDIRGLYRCHEGECAPVGEDGGVPFDRAGVITLRRAGSQEAAEAGRGFDLLRVAVIDPVYEWRPVGLVTGEASDEGPLWWQVAHDGADMFGYVRRGQSLASRWTPINREVAAWSTRDGATGVLVGEVPQSDNMVAEPPMVSRSALVTLVTRESRCPDETASAFRHAPRVSVEDLLLDETFFVHLAQDYGNDRPYRCLASARFRVRERRILSSSGPLRLGVLGDALLIAYMPPADAGVALGVPLLYSRLIGPGGTGLDLSLLSTMSAAIDSGQVDRSGIALSAAVFWGPSGVAPRLFTAGVALHVLDLTRPIGETPSVSPFVGVNLGTLFDAVGAR